LVDFAAILGSWLARSVVTGPEYGAGFVVGGAQYGVGLVVGVPQYGVGPVVFGTQYRPASAANDAVTRTAMAPIVTALPMC